MCVWSGTLSCPARHHRLLTQRAFHWRLRAASRAPSSSANRHRLEGKSLRPGQLKFHEFVAPNSGPLSGSRFGPKFWPRLLFLKATDAAAAQCEAHFLGAKPGPFF